MKKPVITAIVALGLALIGATEHESHGANAVAMVFFIFSGVALFFAFVQFVVAIAKDS